MKQLNSWFSIDEKEYMWYILKGYTITYTEYIIVWRLDDRLHREDGPAVLQCNGSRYYLNGKRYTDGTFSKEVNLKDVFTG